MTLDERKNRGHAAERLLRDPLFVEAWDRLDAETTRAWRNAKEPEERERLWHAQDVLAKLRQSFATLVQDGKLAERKIEEIAKAPRKAVSDDVTPRRTVA